MTNRITTRCLLLLAAMLCSALSWAQGQMFRCVDANAVSLPRRAR